MQKMGVQIFVEGAQPTIIGLLAGFVTVIVFEVSQALGVENKNMVKLATILRLSSAQNLVYPKGPKPQKPCELNSYFLITFAYKANMAQLSEICARKIPSLLIHFGIVSVWVVHSTTQLHE